MTQERNATLLLAYPDFDEITQALSEVSAKLLEQFGLSLKFDDLTAKVY
jgi:hypothetical protein